VKEDRLIKKIEEQAKKFKLRAQKGRGDEKRHDAVRPDEQKWMWTAHHELGWSFAKIGSTFNRDPRTVQKAIASYKPTGQKKRRPGEPLELPLGFDQDQWASLTGMIESGFLFMVGQNISAQMATLESRVMRSFGCHDIGLKQLQHALSLCPSRRLDAWLDSIRGVESLLLHRKTIQEQILASANNSCKSLGPVELLDKNFPLVAYHFFARGDETWLEDDCFQMVEMGSVDSPSRHLECPLSPYYSINLQRWDCRGFVCPLHELPLVERMSVISPSTPLHDTPSTHMWPYQEEESVVTIEDIARKHPSKGALSLRIPKLLPFSEVVIAIGELPTMDELKSLLQGFLRSSPALKEKARMNEADLQRSWDGLLESLRSVLPAHPD
jgi:hypothetical protein